MQKQWGLTKIRRLPGQILRQQIRKFSDWRSPHVKYQIDKQLFQANKIKDATSAMHALRVVQGEGFTPSTDLYDTVLSILRDSGDLDRGVRLFREMHTNEIPIKKSTILIILEIHHRNGDYKACVEILNSLEDYGVENRAQICNQVMGTCVQYEQFHVVESIYNSMEHANISPNYKTFIHLARAYAHHRVDAETIDKVLAQMHKRGIKQSAEIYNGFLACIDSVEQVYDVFGMMEKGGVKPDHESYARLVQVLLDSNRVTDADELLRQLHEKNTYLTAESYIPWIRDASTATMVLERNRLMISRGVVSTDGSLMAVFSTLYNLQAWEELVQEFTMSFKLQERHVPETIYPIVIDAYLHRHDMKSCLDLVQEMRAKGFDTSQIKLELPI